MTMFQKLVLGSLFKAVLMQVLFNVVQCIEVGHFLYSLRIIAVHKHTKVT